MEESAGLVLGCLMCCLSFTVALWFLDMQMVFLCLFLVLIRTVIVNPIELDSCSIQICLHILHGDFFLTDNAHTCYKQIFVSHIIWMNAIN